MNVNPELRSYPVRPGNGATRVLFLPFRSELD